MRKLACSLLLASFVLAVSSWALAAELSAEVVHTAQGQQSVSKVFIKGGKFRMEPVSGPGSQPSGQGFQIVRQDRQAMWMVDPQQRGYIEVPLGSMSDLSRAPKADEKLPGEVSRKKLGGEKINGHPTEKTEITFSQQGQTQTVVMWFAKDLGLPIKTAAQDGSWSVEYRNIVKAPQADSLFEVPAGFTKMSMPAMPQGGYGQDGYGQGGYGR